jgi:uncharacterized protein (DUF952 family)/catechol 2,3-dioxygenase-like lactoylglutathione lyase family enzyme
VAGPLIYVLTTPAALEASLSAGEHRTPSLTSEGFVHASASLEQVLWVANRLYAPEPQLIVLCIDRDRLRSPVKEELTSRGEGPFPHVYGPVNLDALAELRELVQEGDRWAGWRSLTHDAGRQVDYVSMRPNLRVSDVAASSMFYREVLGLDLEVAFPDGSFALLKKGGAELALVRGEAPQQQGAYLYVRGVDDLFTRCRQRGARIVAPLTDHPWGLRDFVVADPDGHWIAVGERAAPA